MVHCRNRTHVPKVQTLLNVGEQDWLVGSNRHGIPKSYIIEVIKAYVDCNFGQPRNEGRIDERCGI
jgi:hypothetical protein